MVLALHTVQRIDDIVARTQAECRAPSLIAAVIRDGVIAHVQSAGEAQPGEIPVPDRDTQYRIGSISKTFTAALVLMLQEEGHLSLDDPVCTHLPLKGFDDVRLRQLLAQAGGLQREPDGDWWERSPGLSLPDLLATVTEAKRAFAPYERYHYSNLAYGLLGGVIEKATGGSWWDAVSARLLGPLGMNRTTYQAEEPFARGYVVHPWHQSLREEPRHDSGAMAPAGQLWSTTDDLARWAAVLAAAEPTLMPARVVAQMVAPAVIADVDSWASGYGLGLQLWRRGERVFVGHTGSMPGYLAVLAVHRPTGTGVVAFTNTYSLPGRGIGSLGLSIVEAVLDGEPSSPPTPWRPAVAAPPEFEPLCGRWWWMGREYEASWDTVTSHLVVMPRLGLEPWRFTRAGDDLWRGLTGEQAGEVLQVSRDANGTPIALDIATFVFTRDPLPAE